MERTNNPLSQVKKEQVTFQRYGKNFLQKVNLFFVQIIDEQGQISPPPHLKISLINFSFYLPLESLLGTPLRQRAVNKNFQLEILNKSPIKNCWKMQLKTFNYVIPHCGSRFSNCHTNQCSFLQL